MTGGATTYAVVTPVRNEAENLVRLTHCLEEQTVPPSVWVLVDNGSIDETPRLARSLAREHPWIRLVQVPGQAAVTRGGSVVRAFHAGLDALPGEPDVVVKLDADLSMEPDYFERLLDAFAADPLLGIASGTCYELEDGEWVQRYMTGTSAWGASRAYRRRCLQQVLPLEERMGWDGIDEFKANMRGWRTRTLLDLPFRHHRVEGARDGPRRAAWAAQGRASHYMGYRGWYLVLRALHNARREPSALAMIWGYVTAKLRREPQCPDASVREYLRREQAVRKLPVRMREAAGRRSA